MSLTPGTRLGVYEITAQIGAGGMGEVYRARDTKLNRDVAIKVLPESFANDPDRLARFEREAQVLASLNHPNIAHIHGLEEGPGVASGFSRTSALVMELVEGDDLSAIIARGPMPLADALPIAKQIADALEAAHEQGIIHRDLKPANIKVRADGAVKVLDFGLAKALDPAAASSMAAMNSPTLSVRATQMGLIIGTAAYMAPEQARGKAVDRRADIWAFGVVLYEMLSAQRAFKGEDISVTLASVIKDEVDWQALPADLPEPIRRLLRRCLEKDPKRRLRDIGEARLTLEDPASSTPATIGPVAATDAPRAAIPFWRRAILIAATAVVVGAVVGGLMWSFRTPPPVAPVVTRFPIVLPDDQQVTRPNVGMVAVSPDGARIVYAANRQLYIRSMGEVEARPIPGTDVDAASPFFSPDGQWVGFHSVPDSLLKKIAIGGGAPLNLCKVDAIWGANWDGETIVFASATRGIMRVSANGGEPEVVVKIGAGEAADGPQMLDGGRLLLFTLASEVGPERWDRSQVIVQSMASGERHVLVRGGSAARYLPTGLGSPNRAERDDGHLVYAVGNSLLAVPFDVTRLEARGAPVPIVEQVARSVNPALQSGVAQYDVSATGMIAYLPGRSSASLPKTLAFAGRDGKIQPINLPAQQYLHPRLSPDGRQLVVETDDGRDAVVWVYDLKAGGALRRLTFGGRNRFPIWTRDGRFITFQSDREGAAAIFRQPADGSGPAERLTKPGAGASHEPESWSPDGKTLSMNVVTTGNQSVWTTATDPEATPKAFADTLFVEKHSSFSPDGRWVAYMASSANSTEVFIQPFPQSGAKYQASSGLGRAPAWAPDGKQLFFHTSGLNRFVVVDIRAEQGLAFGTPVPLPIDGTIHPASQRNYDVTPDGKQLVVVLPAQTAQNDPSRRASEQINVVLNWFEELKAHAPRK
jgi:serine/threonine-protein kinase